MGRMEKLLEALPLLDWDKTGTSALRDVFSKLAEKDLKNVVSRAIRASSDEKKMHWNHFFTDIRQPDWWAGDSEPHPAPEHVPISKLGKILSSGEFAITAEVVPLI